MKLFSGFVFVVLFNLISWKAFTNLVLGFPCFMALSSRKAVKLCQVVTVNNYKLR